MTRKIDYGKYMHKAMRGLIAEVLSDVAENGLPEGHHFMITFDTTHPGVDMPDHVREHYTEDGDLTIIMRNWFENLAVMPDRFGVTLSFGGQAEALVIPFESLKTFIDPSVEFGLKFDGHEMEDLEESEEEIVEEPPTEEETDEKPGEVVSLDTFRKH